MRNQPYLSFNLSLGNSGRRPSAEQLIESIAGQLRGHSLAPGCRLPPVRVLAHQLGLSKNTVQRAYDELMARGLVESRKRVGLFLAAPQKEVVAAPRKQVSAPAFKAEPPRPVSTSSKVNWAERPIVLSGVSIDPELLPTEKFAACMRSVLKDRIVNLAEYPDAQGFFHLRKKIAQRLNRRGIPARPEEIVTTLGSQQCLDLVCRALADKKVATENPAYHVGKALFEMNDIELAGLPLNPFQGGVDLEEWERLIRRIRPGLLYLVTRFQNPTGYSYSTGELNRIIDWSHDYGFGILEDDWGSEMLSFSEFRPALRARGGDNVLYMNSFTKKLLPSLRLGYLVGNEQTTPALVRSKSLSVLSTPLVIEAAVFEFLDRGYYDVHLKQLHAELDQRYQLCLKVLRQTMPEGVKWTTPGGGPVLWLEVPGRASLHAIIERLARKNIVLWTCEWAFFGKPHLHGFRINYARLAPPDLQRGLEELAGEIRRELG